jgi:hypothetical protein
MNSQLSATSRSRIRNRSGKLAGANIRNYPQPTGLESAIAGIYRLARKQPSNQFLESSDNDPINSGNHPTDSKNASIIHRRCDLIHRSDCRIWSVEGSRNHQIASPLDQPSASPNRKVLVNGFLVIVNSAALNPSTIHHQNAELCHRVGSPPAIRVLDLSDNHPTEGADLEADEKDKG